MYPLEKKAQSPLSNQTGSELLVLIGDSSGAARERLRSLLLCQPGIRIVSECSEGPQTLHAITHLRPQLAFLEARLPRLDAFALCRALGEIVPKIIFVTSSTEDAARAFDLQAIDYIVKPYTDERLLLAIERARQSVRSGQVLRTLLREARGGGDELLALRTRNAVQLLPYHEIIWVQSQGATIRIHAAGRSYGLSCTIGEMAPRLPESRFIRVNREAIVNLAQVDEIRKAGTGFDLFLLDGTVVPLGRRFRKAFEARISAGTLSLAAAPN